MLQKYISKLILNLPPQTNTQVIDLVLDGGAFNGSYLAGAMLFLKTMESHNYIRVSKISGCSIGSVVALLYFANNLNLMRSTYASITHVFKTTHLLDIKHILYNIIKSKLPEDICNIVNKRLYISYYNIQTGKQVVKCKYKTVNEILDTIYKSCFIPYIMDGNLCYKNKYIDGLMPYIFEPCNYKKIMYLDLLGKDKILDVMSIKNEKTNYHRILNGILDIHLFYIKNTTTSMCSYVNDWTITHRYYYNFKWLISILIANSIYYYNRIISRMPVADKTSVMNIIGKKIIEEVYIILLERYCL